MLRPDQTRGTIPFLVLAAALGVGCSDDPTVPSTKQTFTLVPGAASVSLKPSESKTTFVKAARIPGFAGPISFSVTAVSTELTVSIIATSTADSARVDISANADASGTLLVLISGASAGHVERLTIPVAVAP